MNVDDRWLTECTEGDWTEWWEICFRPSKLQPSFDLDIQLRDSTTRLTTLAMFRTRPLFYAAQ